MTFEVENTDTKNTFHFLAPLLFQFLVLFLSHHSPDPLPIPLHATFNKDANDVRMRPPPPRKLRLTSNFRFAKSNRTESENRSRWGGDFPFSLPRIMHFGFFASEGACMSGAVSGQRLETNAGGAGRGFGTFVKVPRARRVGVCGGLIDRQTGSATVRSKMWVRIGCGGEVSK